jgi:hypothetical protein
MIIGSIFPEKLTFNGFYYRTTRINEAIRLIYMVSRALDENKNGQPEENFELSIPVAQPGFEPRQTDPESVVLPLYYWAIEPPKRDRKIREFSRYLPKLPSDLAKNIKYPVILPFCLALTLLPRQGRPQASAVKPQAQASATRPQPSANTRTQASTNAPATAKNPADSTIRAAFTLLDSVFNRPQFLYETIGPDIPADMQPILVRFNNALATNRQWFNEYRNKYSRGPLPYDPRFGISAEEYFRVQHLEAVPPALVPIDSQTVSVLKEAGVIHLKCSSADEHFLDYLYIDPAHNLLEYGGDTIPYAGPATAGPKSAYGQWRGYSWHLERTDAQSLGQTTLLTVRVVEVNIGIPPDGKKTFIRISYQNIQAGTPTANMELLGYIL